MKVYDFKGNVIYDDPILQEKEATENGEVLPDNGYDGLSKVIVNVESSVDLPIAEEGTF